MIPATNLRRFVIAAVLLGFGLAGCATNDMSRQFDRKYNAPSAEEQVAMVLDPDDPDRRRQGIEYLAAGPTAQDEATLKLFALVSREDSSAFVRSAAVSALGLGEDPAFADALIDALEDTSPMVRAEAAEALSITVSPEALRPLIRSAERDTDVAVRYQATRSLPAYREDDSIRTLVYLLDDPELTVHREAHKALIELYGEDLGTEPGPWARRADQGLPPEGTARRRWWHRSRETDDEPAPDGPDEPAPANINAEDAAAEDAAEDEATPSFWDRFRRAETDEPDETDDGDEVDMETLPDAPDDTSDDAMEELLREDPLEDRPPERIDVPVEIPTPTPEPRTNISERPARPPALVTPDD